ncbi:MAG: hypothetical protein QOE00_2162 [Ilumatobacteraceae bacterium]|jgi:hypothetical protein
MSQHGAHTVALIFHLIGLVFGVGGATVTDLIFVTGVRKRHVGHTLQVVMEAASKVVVAGYGVLVVSGVVLITTGTHATPRFWAKMVVVAVIGINGAVAHRVTFPKLSGLMHTNSTGISIGFLHQLSVTAAVSATSWYAALIIGAWKTTWVPFAVWMIVFGAATLAAVLISLLLTPRILRVDDPEFDTVFPVLANAALRSADVWPKNVRLTQRSFQH